MTALTFVHTADCHLDTPFAGVARQDPELAQRLRQAQRAVFDDLIDLCLKQQAAFLVIAGDLYDAQERSLVTRVRLREAFRRLEAAGVDVFLALGNHDNFEESRSGLAFPPNVHIFSHERPQTFLWPEERPVASITGMSYGRRAVDECLAANYPPPADDLFSLAVLHCNLDGDAAHDNYAPARLDDLVRSGYRYWALGHIHDWRVMNGGRTTVVYPGCLQGRRIRELGRKGATLVTVDEGGAVEPRFVALDRVQWGEIAADVSDAAHEEELVEALRERMNECAAQTDPHVEGLMLRLRLTGLPGCGRGALDRALAMLRETAFEHEPFRWPESLDTRGVALPVDWAELALAQTPQGDLVRLVEAIRSDPARLEALRDCLLERSGPTGVDELLPAHCVIEEILDEALRLGVDWLGRTEE